MKMDFEAMKADYEAAWNTPEKLYQHKSMYYTGRIPKTQPEGGKYYSEIIAGDVVDRELFQQIRPFCRAPQAPYAPHDFSVIQYSRPTAAGIRRREENIAYGLCRNGKEADGSRALFLDYQYPIVLLRRPGRDQEERRRQQEEAFGKADLIYESGNMVYLTELKNDRSREPLLRCVMEVSTYAHQLDPKRFCSHFHCQEAQIGKAVMMFEDTRPFKDYVDLRKGNRPRLAALCRQENIAFFMVETTLERTGIPTDLTGYTIRRLDGQT